MVELVDSDGRPGFRAGDLGWMFSFDPRVPGTQELAYRLASEQDLYYRRRRASAGRLSVGRAIPQQPDALRRRYTARLQARATAAYRLLVGALRPLLEQRQRAEAQRLAEEERAATEARSRADVGEPSIDDFLQVIASVEAAFESAYGVDEDGLEDLARQLDLFTSGDQKRMINTVVGLDIGRTPELQALYKTWTAGNVDLIKSISSDFFDQIRDQVYTAVRDGTLTQDLVQEIRDRYNVSTSRAQTIARDQIGKLNGEITMHRQVSVGVKKYRWATSNDERVRDTHRALNGKIFDWSSPPPEGHPGWPINCRCGAIPVWEDDEDLALPPSTEAQTDALRTDSAVDRLDIPRALEQLAQMPRGVYALGWDLAVPFPVFLGAYLAPARLQVSGGKTRRMLVDMDRLVATQSGVRSATLLEMASGGVDLGSVEMPLAWRDPADPAQRLPLVCPQADGALAILDGHHRLSFQRLAGAQVAEVLVWVGHRSLALSVLSVRA